MRFTLYIYPDTLSSNRAIANVRRIGRDVLGDRYDLSIVNVLEQPEIARRAGVRTTPTLVRHEPPTRRTITGDLSDRERVLAALKLGA